MHFYDPQASIFILKLVHDVKQRENFIKLKLRSLRKKVVLRAQRENGVKAEGDLKGIYKRDVCAGKIAVDWLKDKIRCTAKR